MRKNLALYISNMRLRIAKERYIRYFYRLRNPLLGMLPYKKVYPSHQWRVIILAGLSEQQYYRVHTDYIIPLRAIESRLKVIRSKLRSTNEVVGYLEIWDEGKLKRQKKLCTPLADILAIRYAFGEQCFEDQLFSDILFVTVHNSFCKIFK